MGVGGWCRSDGVGVGGLMMNLTIVLKFYVYTRRPSNALSIGGTLSCYTRRARHALTRLGASSKVSCAVVPHGVVTSRRR